MAATRASTTESVAETYTVSPSGSINSISKAIGLSKDGDTVEVEKGAYKGRIVVDKSIKLIGIDKPSIYGQGKRTTIKKREFGLLKRKKIETFQVILYDVTGLGQKN
ncbi:hypothetical protein MYX76_12435 [Desulfobacterota bacterium AH_259_B03_O07]|nr:hypothetical protein [Desulfobacterota bacterium AH_259_B03_O07]